MSEVPLYVARTGEVLLDRRAIHRLVHHKAFHLSGRERVLC